MPKAKLLRVTNSLLTLMCLTLIVYYSTRDGEQTYRDSEKLTQLVSSVVYRRELSAAEFAALNIKLREAAHVVLYGFLGTVSGLWAQIGKTHGSRVGLMAVTGVSCVMIGLTDEYLKQYVPGRHFHVNDFMLNSCSALAGLFICCTACMVIRILTQVAKRAK
ncbi:MAG: VanZ family protein [Oscillospiraceae bacterium]|nr:VanZ family protein [Oscillospiraceae bacterium]